MEKMTLEQATSFFAELYGGENKIPGEIKQHGFLFSLNDNRSEFSTYDGNLLTRLVLLAHEKCVRVTVGAKENDNIIIFIWQRKRDGDISLRHPTIEKAIESFRGYPEQHKVVVQQKIADIAASHIKHLPDQDIVDGLAQKKLRLVYTEYYAVKEITGKDTMQFFKYDDVCVEGFGNLKGGKTQDPIEWFLLLGLQYMEGVSSSPLHPSQVIFDAPYAITSNGHLTLLANGCKYVMKENTPLSIFTDIQENNGFLNKKNCVELQIPLWIEPQVSIHFNARFADPNNISPFTFGRVKLIGVSVIPD